MKLKIPTCSACKKEVTVLETDPSDKSFSIAASRAFVKRCDSNKH